jgi:uncharacterized membrane protein YccC
VSTDKFVKPANISGYFNSKDFLDSLSRLERNIALADLELFRDTNDQKLSDEDRAFLAWFRAFRKRCSRRLAGQHATLNSQDKVSRRTREIFPTDHQPSPEGQP